jgi:RND family efflux transporter MFP subunit
MKANTRSFAASSFALASLAFGAVLGGPLSCKGHAASEADKTEARTVAVHCVKPKKESLEETVSLRGRIEPPPGGDLSVASQVAGRVVSVAVKEGDRVGPGDVVATMEDAPVRDAARQTDAALAQARAADINAAATLERTKALVARGIAARQELEDATAKAAAAREAVAGAVAASDVGHRTLGRVQVRSGLAGLVTKVFRGAGALVDGTAATPILQLAATGGSELVADVTQRELMVLAEGQPVKGALAGEGGIPIEGAIRARPRSIDAATGLGTVRIALTSRDAQQLPVGAFGRVMVVTGHHDAALVVPTTALRGAVSDGAELAVCAGERASLKVVKIGYRDDKRVEILGGIGPDDTVAVDHVLALEDDTPIKRMP